MARYQRLPKVITAQGRDLASLARDYTEPALNKLIGLMQNGKTEAVQAQCAQYILDRGWGKVPSTDATRLGDGPITVEIVYRQRDTTETERPLIDVTPGASPVLPTSDKEHN
jgi:hypothetical protein